MKKFFLFFAFLWLGFIGASAQKYHYDVNTDGDVNITDAVLVVNKILGKANPGEVEGLEEVDLGLPSGTIWANINVGATKPEEYGNYYAWGETATKSKYSQDTYQYYQNGSIVNIGSDISGTQYDVATALWGEDWCMPTKEQADELYINCTWEWTIVNGVNGGKFTSKTNGNSIFLPAAGYRYYSGLWETGNVGSYWSSHSPYNSNYAYGIHFHSNNGYCDYYYRGDGSSVRPVRNKRVNVPAQAVDLGLPSGTMWASHNVGASSPEECGNYYAWGETEVKNEYDFETYTHLDEYGSLCKDIGSNISGTKYDVAHVKWGGNWRMPTGDEVDELFENCTFKWTKYNGVDGGLFTGPNGNSVFLPAGGRANLTDVEWRDGGYYWTGTEDTMGECAAVDLCFGQSGVEWYHGGERDFGFLVRPVNAPLPSNMVVAEAIDLGLPSGTKWASCNIGASKPEECGEYFAWGELLEKKVYSKDNYLYYNSELDENMWLGEDISGTKYDVARQRWGGNWRLPTSDEVVELIENCTYVLTTYNGVQGGKFTSKKNGNSIFLPAAGYRLYNDLIRADSYGYYWSSTNSVNSTMPGGFGLFFTSSHVNWSALEGFSGNNIRPVVGN